jgi:hypothetical protein
MVGDLRNLNDIIVVRSVEIHESVVSISSCYYRMPSLKAEARCLELSQLLSVISLLDLSLSTSMFPWVDFFSLVERLPPRWRVETVCGCVK